MRSILDSRVTDDLYAVSRAAWILNAASRREDAEGLKRFFVRCNVERLITTDDACRKETIATAIAKGRALPRQRDDALPAPPDLALKLEQTLSLFVPDADRLRAATDERNWRRYRIDGRGVVRYDSPAGAHLFIAARNRSAWEIANVHAVLTLPMPSGATVDLACGPRNPFPFETRTMPTSADATLHCDQRYDWPLEDVIAALHAIPEPDAPPARIVRFDLRNPYATVADSGAGAAPRFTAAPMPRLFIEARDESITMGEGHLPAELAAMDCHTLETCSSPLEALAMTLAAPFGAHALLLPPLFGILVGLIIGGFARRSLALGGAFAGLLLAGTAAGIGWLFMSVSSQGGENGFALMGVAALTYGAIVSFVLGLPAFFLTLGLTKVVRAREHRPGD